MSFEWHWQSYKFIQDKVFGHSVTSSDQMSFSLPYSYISSIASFLIIAMPIFSGNYDKLTQPELSKMISETSFVCMYLSYQLSKLVEMSVQVRFEQSLAILSHFCINNVFFIMQTWGFIFEIGF